MKQTALAQWPLDAPTRFLIDPAQLQPGQWWTAYSNVKAWNRGTAIDPDCPVWVSELLEIPEPLPEIAWLDGVPIAMYADLPHGTLIANSLTGVEYLKPLAQGVGSKCPVVIVAWPDGSKPVPPEDGG